MSTQFPGPATQVSFRIQTSGVNNDHWPGLSYLEPQLPSCARAPRFCISLWPLLEDPVIHKTSGPVSDPWHPLTHSRGCTAEQQQLPTLRDPVGSSGPPARKGPAFFLFGNPRSARTCSWKGHVCHLLAVGGAAPGQPSWSRSEPRSGALAQAQVSEGLVRTGRRENLFLQVLPSVLPISQGRQ